MRFRFFVAIAFAALSVPVTAFADTFAYIGTYTGSGSDGIYVSSFDSDSGALSAPKLAAVLENPSFIALHPSHPLLYAVSEVKQESEDSIGLAAYSIQADGSLKLLNTRSTRGGAPCHLSVDPTGQCVAVANYTGGSCISFPLLEDGSLGEEGSFHQHLGGSGGNPKRQSAPHAHSLNFNHDGTQAFVADLGKDQVLMYDVDAENGQLSPSEQPFVQLPVGGGPRHFALHPNGRHAFSNLEMTSQVAGLNYSNEDRSLTLRDVVSSLPAGVVSNRNSTAECLVHPNGRLLFVSNRGHNSIAAYTIDEDTGGLTHVGNTSTSGEIPRGFGIDPTGKFLVVGNQNSGSVVTLRIDPESGKLAPIGKSIEVSKPVNVRFYSK